MNILETGRPQNNHDIWEGAWFDELGATTLRVPSMSNQELAVAMRWAREHNIYYHTALCDLLEATVNEAAKRLEQ